MKTLLRSLPLVWIATVLPAEAPARRLTPVPLTIAGTLAHISAAGELAGGAVVLTDQNAPAVWLIAPGSGALTQIGSAGGGERQYIQPGGIYPGANRTTLVLDRAQARVLVLSAAGAIERMYSIAVRGTSGGSDADLDRQRLDARDLAYFIDGQRAMAAMLSGQAPAVATVLRFDAARQERTPVVTDLRVPEERSRSGGQNVVLSQQIIGSPADGWGVAPDGRVAVVRASPYRVDWISVAGKVARGPVIAYDPLPMTEADKQAFIAGAGKGPAISAGVGGGGNATQRADMPEHLFAATKPPFEPDDVLVSPEAKVWVLRTSTRGAADAIYDVFDDAGQRVDRIAFPAGHRIVGFGAGVVFVREPATNGHERLRKYQVK